MMSPARRAVALALVGGYVDAVGYVMLRGLFPNHVTGNLPIAAAHGGMRVLPALLMVPLWLAAVVAVAGVAGRVRDRDPSQVLPTVLALEAALLGVFLLLGVGLVPDPDASTLVTQTIVTGAGVWPWPRRAWSAASPATPTPRPWSPARSPFWGWTGLRRCSAASPTTTAPACRSQIRALGRAVAAFAAGAGLGGLAVHRLQFWAIASRWRWWPCARSRSAPVRHFHHHGTQHGQYQQPQEHDDAPVDAGQPAAPVQAPATPEARPGSRAPKPSRRRHCAREGPCARRPRAPGRMRRRSPPPARRRARRCRPSPCARPGSGSPQPVPS